MRRTDREIADCNEIIEILSRCNVIRLGINTPDYPYVVPMNFGFENDGKALTIWLHSAPVGLKLDLLRSDTRVGFEADCSHRLIVGERACNFTMEYESVMGYGNITICNDLDDKKRGLKAIMLHYVPDAEFDFTDAELSSVCVLRLDVLQITGKRLKKT